MALFDGAGLETDHRFFRNLGKTDFRPDIAAWCEATFERSQMLLDDDFPARFRRETPQRISELLFAAAFLDAGWEPLGRVPGFDLAFKLGEGRLLVEITTPEPHSADTWTETKGDGYTSWSTDAKTEDAALRRLTGSFATKAEAIRKHCDAGEISAVDYIVVAISGFRLSQETPVAPEIGGPVPDFAKAFLPIGSRYVTVRLGDDTDTPMDGGWHFKATIDQEGKNPVDRDFFLRDNSVKAARVLLLIVRVADTCVQEQVGVIGLEQWVFLSASDGEREGREPIEGKKPVCAQRLSSAALLQGL